MAKQPDSKPDPEPVNPDPDPTPTKMEQDQLDLLSTSDLVDAIYRRMGPGGSVLLVTNNDRINDELTGLHYRGGTNAALGLVIWAKHKLLTKIEKPNNS